jgi:hypothetical protein
MKPTLKLIEAAGVNIEWDSHLAGADALKKHRTTLPKQMMDSLSKDR